MKFTLKLLYFRANSPSFVKDAEFRAFQNELLMDPERGDLLVGCRGLRKARMALAGR